jgi:Mg2+ and Co2+ transporter CorA
MMDNRKVRKFSRKLSAVGFIVMTLVGNFWFVNFIFKKATPIWLEYFLYIGIFLLACGGLGLILAYIHQLLYGEGGEADK